MNEHRNFRQEKINAFAVSLAEVTDLDQARQMADQAFAEKDSELKMQLLSMSAAINPLAVTNLPAGSDASRMFTFDAWRKSIAMARMVAANTARTRVLVASAPKTGSTFLASAISRTYGLDKVSLTMLSAKSYGHYMLGGALRDHDVDELALITNGFIPMGYVAHHHMICTPYLGKQARLYGIVPVITKRNIFDTLVSFDDHLRNLRPSVVQNCYLELGYPDAWFGMDFEDRMAFMLDIQLPWYAKYYSSWKECEKQGDISPLWISYEADILGDKRKLAEKLAAKLNAPATSIDKLTEELGRKDAAGQHFNKGVSGRGSAITGKNRQKIEDFLHRFRSVCDLSDLLNG